MFYENDSYCLLDFLHLLGFLELIRVFLRIRQTEVGAYSDQEFETLGNRVNRLDHGIGEVQVNIV